MAIKTIQSYMTKLGNKNAKTRTSPTLGKKNGKNI